MPSAPVRTGAFPGLGSGVSHAPPTVTESPPSKKAAASPFVAQPPTPKSLKEYEEPTQLGLRREAWGPRFWKVLHTLAELVGKQKGDILNNDEADAWQILLRAQEFVMPCALCRSHYAEMILLRRPDGLRGMAPEARRTWVREWLLMCHNRVNRLNKKEAFVAENLEASYPKQSIQPWMEELGTMFQLAVAHAKLKSEDIVRWRQAVARLRALYGV